MLMRIGFSLVELSIVLVILGLLTGGILAGQSLIRAAEVRSVVTEYQRYRSATLAFRDKYFAVPGDMTNATSFWGKDNTNCATNTGTAATPGTCNGDGDGVIDSAVTAGQTGEDYQFWKQLALAGLIEGNYSGLNGTPSGTVPGANVPAGRISTSMWYTSACCAGGGATFTLSTYARNFRYAGTGFVSILKPEENWNVDVKLDDGKPARGFVVGSPWSGCTNAASATDFNADYALTSTGPLCNIIFPNAY